ncbi:unnamed protein product [Ectocarpus sp. 8 AP-2014]
MYPAQSKTPPLPPPAPPSTGSPSSRRTARGESFAAVEADDGGGRFGNIDPADNNDPSGPAIRPSAAEGQQLSSPPSRCDRGPSPLAACRHCCCNAAAGYPPSRLRSEQDSAPILSLNRTTCRNVLLVDTLGCPRHRRVPIPGAS